MKLETLFLIVNNSVIPAWVLLWFAPRWKWTQRLVHSAFLPGLLAVAYGLILFTDRPGPQGANFMSLDGVMRIFTSPQTVIAAWLHYLVFDLFVGAWIGRDALRLNVRHYWVMPCQLLTLLFGPLGLLLWFAVRGGLVKRTTLVETD